MSYGLHPDYFELAAAQSARVVALSTFIVGKALLADLDEIFLCVLLLLRHSGTLPRGSCL